MFLYHKPLISPVRLLLFCAGQVGFWCETKVSLRRTWVSSHSPSTFQRSWANPISASEVVRLSYFFNRKSLCPLERFIDTWSAPRFWLLNSDIEFISRPGSCECGCENPTVSCSEMSKNFSTWDQGEMLTLVAKGPPPPPAWSCYKICCWGPSGC